MEVNKIILLGYMGSGKSTVGNALAKALGYTFLDLDDVIEKVEGKSIAEIFSSHDELYFRALERKCLEDTMAQSLPIVLSLGGGTPCFYNTMDYLLAFKQSSSFYLKASFDTLSNRLFKEKEHRPLIAHLNHIEEAKEFIGKHLFERSLFYQKALHQILTDGKSVDQIILEIKAKLT